MKSFRHFQEQSGIAPTPVSNRTVGGDEDFTKKQLTSAQRGYNKVLDKLNKYRRAKKDARIDAKNAKIDAKNADAKAAQRAAVRARCPG